MSTVLRYLTALAGVLVVHSALAGVLVVHSALAGGDATRGQSVYQARCSTCHSPDFNGVGPAHRGVFGRAIGRAPGYAYSPALQASNGTWSTDTLDRWLADPEKLLPGQRMGVSLGDPQARADVIEYLKTLVPRE